MVHVARAYALCLFAPARVAGVRFWERVLHFAGLVGFDMVPLSSLGGGELKGHA